jgi:MYXO-CTERM domain-containing protein
MNGLGSTSANRGPGQDVYVYETLGATGAATEAGGAQINSNKGSSWLSSRGTGNYLTISDISDLVIAPPPSSWFAGTNGTGSGAPRELGTGVAFGFNWIMGSVNATDGNYSQVTPYDLSGISVVPAPGALALLGVAGFASRRRRA